MLLCIIPPNFRLIAEIFKELERELPSGRTEGRADGRNDRRQYRSGRWRPRVNILVPADSLTLIDVTMIKQIKTKPWAYKRDTSQRAMKVGVTLGQRRDGSADVHTGGTRSQRGRLCPYCRSRLCPYQPVACRVSRCDFCREEAYIVVNTCISVVKFVHDINLISEELWWRLNIILNSIT